MTLPIGRSTSYSAGLSAEADRGAWINLGASNFQTNPLPGTCAMATEHVLFSGDINEQSVDDLLRKVFAISGRENDICILMNSTGGWNNPAKRCYEMLRTVPTELSTHNIGQIDSSAILIYLAGERRYATELSSFQFNPQHWTFSSPVTIKDLRDATTTLQGTTAEFSRIYASRTPKTADEIARLFERVERFSATWAVENGLAHEIAAVTIPAGQSLQ